MLTDVLSSRCRCHKSRVKSRNPQAAGVLLGQLRGTPSFYPYSTKFELGNFLIRIERIDRQEIGRCFLEMEGEERRCHLTVYGS